MEIKYLRKLNYVQVSQLILSKIVVCYYQWVPGVTIHFEDKYMSDQVLL